MLSLLFLLIVWIPPQEGAPSSPPGYVIVVHPDIQLTQLSRVEVSRLFLKKIVRWKDPEVKVVPVDREVDSKVRMRFSQDIHGKGVGAIRAYWQRRIFSGRDVPPVVINDDEAVLDYVSKHPGAVGYVSPRVNLSPWAVRVVHVE